MKESVLFLTLMGIFTFFMGQLGVFKKIQHTTESVHRYEYKALELSKKNRYLLKENRELEARIATLESEKEHLLMNSKSGEHSYRDNNKSKPSRFVASISRKNTKDLVNYDLYRWSSEKLYGVGNQSFHFKKFNKSAQFFNALINEFPNNELINDKTLFQAGVAAYESKIHYDWAVKHFSTLIKRYPKSKYYRGAKLWLGLSQFHKGDKKNFMATVEEFRSKYRNTKEWKVLSRYYEDLAYKYGRK